jgi:ribonuclease HI
VVAGDFNFVECASDTAGRFENSCLSKDAGAAWEKVKLRLKLFEVRQDAHTRYRRGKKGTSSRLDRFYTSTSTAELAILSQRTFPIATGSFWNKDPTTLHSRLNKGELVPLISGLSDHIAVGLDVMPSAPQNRGPADVPAWIAAVPGYGEAVVKEFGVQTHSDKTAFKDLARWIAASRKVYKRMVKGTSTLADKYGGQVAKLTEAVRLLRLCTRGKPDHDQISKLSRTHVYLNGLVRRTQLTGSVYCTEKLEEFVERMYGEGFKEIAKDHSSADADDTAPASYLPGETASDNFMTDIKTRLPGDRSRLTALRSTLRMEATSDPVELDKVVGTYYTGVWAEDAGAADTSEIGTYLRDYNKRVSAANAPVLPSREEVEDVIQLTNDSCSGPDGTPFACYRADCRAGGPISSILHRILRFLCAGGKGPATFNAARLFLIAKTDSLLVQDTRPISVTDASNRIIASCLAAVLTPVLQTFLEKAQKGFCPGRVGTEHVHGLTEEFYGALTKKQQMYLLSLDTARAFDSISHAFIRKLLPHIGMPRWVCALVDGLLHKVTVVAAISGGAGKAIPICRGVKQGCPFSPLLFVLCFDVLLWRLAKLPGLKAFAFADDLALTTASPVMLLQALGHIRKFSRASGLGLNAKKTVIVTTKPLNARVRGSLDEAGWSAIKSAPKCVYLGVAVGAKVGTIDIFAAAVRKFFRRLASYSPYLKKVSMHTRIVVANVFLLPLLYYLAQFYIVPYREVVLPVRRALHQMVVPFRGTAFAYAHLLTARSKGGPFVPLKDIWCTNVAMLASTYPLELSEGCGIPEMGEKDHRLWWLTQWGAMNKCITPSGHAAYCAFMVLEDFARRKHGTFIDLKGLPGAEPNKAAKRRAWIYGLCADKGFVEARRDPKNKTSLGRKIGRFVTGPPVGHHFERQAGQIAHTLTPAVWNTQLRLMYNALPFERRRIGAKMEVAARPTPGVPSQHPCYYCGIGEDSAEHVYGQCMVVRAARDEMAIMLGVKLSHDFSVTLLAFPPVENKAVAVSIVCFNWAVWVERTEYVITLGHVPLPKAAVARIIQRARTRVPADKHSGSRKGERDVADYARSPPLDAVVVFTDGSAIPNPGPSGAGLIIRLRGGLDYKTISLDLGYGDNNKGEMAAIRKALEEVAAGVKAGTIDRGTKVLIFTDSALCVGYLTRGWSFPRWADEAHTARGLLRTLRSQVHIIFYWIRGHEGIPGNEEADVAAKKGARMAQVRLLSTGQLRPPQPAPMGPPERRLISIAPPRRATGQVLASAAPKHNTQTQPPPPTTGRAQPTGTWFYTGLHEHEGDSPSRQADCEGRSRPSPPKEPPD